MEYLEIGKYIVKNAYKQIGLLWPRKQFMRCENHIVFGWL
jgi:hypothetical protein